MSRFFFMEEALQEVNEYNNWKRRVRSLLTIERMPDIDFISAYRLNKQAFEMLCEDVVPLLRTPTTRRAITPVMKILAALNFYARGSYQGAVGLNIDAPMSQSSVSRCINEVTDALNSLTLLKKYFKFPQNLQERQILKCKFMEKFRMPGVLGCIDCTHVAIVRPSLNEERYYTKSKTNN